MRRDRLASFWPTNNVGSTSLPVMPNGASGANECPELADQRSSRTSASLSGSGGSCAWCLNSVVRRHPTLFVGSNAGPDTVGCWRVKRPVFASLIGLSPAIQRGHHAGYDVESPGSIWPFRLDGEWKQQDHRLHLCRELAPLAVRCERRRQARSYRSDPSGSSTRMLPRAIGKPHREVAVP